MKAFSGPFLPRALACLAAAALLLAGCSKSPDQLLQKALAAEKAALAAEQRNDAGAARDEADEAEDAAARLKKLADADKSGRPDLGRLSDQAQAAARAAREHAEIAGEKEQLRDRLDGLKIKAYQKTRGFTLATLLPPLALAAESAGRRGTNDVSAFEQQLAGHAWRLASVISARPPLPDGSPDWPGVAADLRGWSTNPPMEFRSFLGLAFVLMGQSDFALAEFETVEAARLGSTNALQLYHGGRALLFALQGWNRLAMREAEAFARLGPLAGGPVSGPQLLALLHGFLAYDAFTKREFARMDGELAQSLRAWPDNPLAVYLTGERLAADGQWEKAADSLEAQAAGTKNEWIARRLAERARDLRDGKGSAKALVLDAPFLAQLAAWNAYQAARHSSAATKLGTAVDEAKAFGRDFLSRLPYIGGAPTGRPTNGSPAGAN